MELRFAPNLDRMWHDEPVPRRFELAAQRGFSWVEFLHPRDHPLEVIDDALSRSGCRLALFNSSGPRDAAVRGRLTWPGREHEFRRAFEQDLELATRWRVSHLHAVAGIPPLSTSRAERMDVALRNLEAVADGALDAGVTVTVEFINQQDRPGFGLASLSDAVELVKTVDHPAVRLQFDQYHVAMSGLDPVEEFLRHQRITSYVQIAEAPGRHEPGGTSSLPAFLDTLRRAEYAGTVSLEYDPRDGTDASLVWLEPWRRAASPTAGSGGQQPQ